MLLIFIDFFKLLFIFCILCLRSLIIHLKIWKLIWLLLLLMNCDLTITFKLLFYFRVILLNFFELIVKFFDIIFQSLILLQKIFITVFYLFILILFLVQLIDRTHQLHYFCLTFLRFILLFILLFLTMLNLHFEIIFLLKKIEILFL